MIIHVLIICISDIIQPNWLSSGAQRGVVPGISCQLDNVVGGIVSYQQLDADPALGGTLARLGSFIHVNTILLSYAL